MNWEEELVLRNRKVKFDKNLIDMTMRNIVKNFQKYINKYEVKLKVYYKDLEYLYISGNKEAKIILEFLEKDTKFKVKVKDAKPLWAEISLNDGMYSVRYENLDKEDKLNPKYNDFSYYDLSEEILSETIKNILILNNKF